MEVNVSAYRLAIVQTITTIDTRTRLFRDFVVADVVLTFGALGWAAVIWTLLPLACLLLLFPAWGLFFLLDAKLVNEWRSRLLNAWIKKEIELTGFCEAVSAIPTLPKETLQSMLATLPSLRDLPTEQQISSSTREATAAGAASIYACQSDAIALNATAFAIAIGSLITAAILWMWQPILGIAVLALLPMLRKWLRRKRLRAFRERTAAARARPDFSNLKYGELVANLSRQPISPAEQRVVFINSRIWEQSPHVFT
jgi:hypothetical protein